MKMKYLKTFETFDADKIYNLGELYPMEMWIKEVWKRLPETENLEPFFNDVTNQCGEDVSKIIDGMYSADKLHYYQDGNTVSTGGIDTGDFIRNFDEYKDKVNSILDDMGY